MRRFTITPILVVLAAAAALAQDSPVVIRAGTLLDGKGGVAHNVSLIVRRGRIAEVTPKARRQADYDLRRFTLMPGWIDTHVHISWHFDKNGRLASEKDESPQQAMLHAAGNAWATLMGGFTTVQSVGAPIDRDLRDAIEQGIIPGPRLLTSLGQINEDTGDPAAIRLFVRKAVAGGADVIKLFATKSIRDGGAQSMSDAQIGAACGEAKALGKRSLVHAHASSGARAAVEAGCTAIEHGTFLDDATLGLLAARGAYFDPNFLVIHNYFENKAKFLGIGNYTEEGFASMEKALPLLADVFHRAMAKHVKIVLGTDAVAGAHGRNAEEFIYRVRDGGQKPMDAIVSGTSLAAESLGLGGKIGAIAPGMEADLVATDDNPLDDITAVRRVVFVMKGGQVYKNSAANEGRRKAPPSPVSMD
ncbi:MAG TPA: amidohydrolase family protein [Bryobacterales bacterium]|nr:amidohydrolase family protein [Bryobacterales bacterium]